MARPVSPLATEIRMPALRRRLAMPLLLAACAPAAPTTTTVQGECGDAFGAQVCTWADVESTGTVSAFGVTVPMGAITGAPEHAEMAWPPQATAVLRMPAEVTAAYGVDHFTMFWEPHGHPPGAFLTPHFDFHFYSIGMPAREAIDCTDTSKPATMAENYILPDEEVPGVGTLVGICVPAMGMHSGPAADFASEKVFDGTMIVGYYQGTPIFFEPMIAQHHLARRASFDVPMPVVPGVPEGVQFPGQFRAEYDAASESYRFTFRMAGS